MAGPVADVGFYQHVRTIIGLVTGLAITRILSGFATLVQETGRHKVHWIHFCWAVSILLSAIHFWWWEFRLETVHWNFGLYVFVIAYASLFYFLTALLFPNGLDKNPTFDEFFPPRQRWFFGILALTFVFDVVDTAIKGGDYLAHFGWEYPVRIGAYLALCVAAMFVRNVTFQGVFAAANLVYQASYILRLYGEAG